ncbi:MAG TPA: hypothetical protein VEA81_09115 [Burkholderiaceae bacterium]|nr:hypothetical protein [Burkholderiaceae bacterium]
MSDLKSDFEQASVAARQRYAAPPHAQGGAALRRLDELYRQATEGDPDQREAAMRQYIELVGDLGQQDA